MGRDQELRSLGRGLALLSEHRQQARVQEVLGLLDADEGGRRRVVQHDQVGQHLERAVRREPRQDRLFEGRVLDGQEQAAIGHRRRVDPLDPRHPLLHARVDLRQVLRVALFQELDDVGQVVAGPTQALLSASLGLAAGVVDRQVRDVPARDEATERGDARVVAQAAQGADRQEIALVERLPHLLVVLDRALAGDHPALALVEAEDAEGRAGLVPLHPAPLQRFLFDERPAVVFVDREAIRGGLIVRGLLVRQLEDDRAGGAAGAEPLEATALLPCCA